jgi:tetratricopeptide (TPR) repeat protein
MIAHLLALTLLGTTSAGIRPGTVEVTANVKDGDVISGEYHFKVTAKANSPITQAEFYVGDDLRDTDSSTPYEFKLDTLGEPEGDVKLTFAVYTTEGDNGKLVVKVKIDNELSKGADYHVDKAVNFLSLSKFDEAYQEARIALKAKPDYNPARMAMARAYLGKGVLDSAQKYAEDVLQSDPGNAEARNLVSGITLRRAFATVNRGGEKIDTLKVIGDDLKLAVESRQKVLAAQVEKLLPVTPDNLLKYADACIAAGRYTAATNELLQAFKKDETRSPVCNRLMYCYLRMSDNKAANDIADIYLKRGQPDAYGYALIAVGRQLVNLDAASDDAIKEAILNDSQSPSVRTAEAYIALRRRKLAAYDKIVQSLASTDAQIPAVNFYLGWLNQYINKYADADAAYQRAVLAEPGCFDIYVQRGCDALELIMMKRIDKKEAPYQYLSAQVMFEAALKAKPDSPEALTGLAIVYGLQKKNAEYVTYSRAAANAGPTYPAGLYVLASSLAGDETTNRNIAMKLEREGNREEAKKYYVTADKLSEEARSALKKAGSLDPVYLVNIAQVPKVEDVYVYFARFGKIPIIAIPTE